jgi:hypothetical protein
MTATRRDRDDAIRLGDRAGGDPTRWGMLLVIFMRLIAALWIVQGLSQWQVMLVVEGVLFDRVSAPIGIAVIVFAVVDLVAAIGLWLATPWGGVLWILVVFAQAIVAVALPGFFEGGRLVVALDALLLGMYLFLTFKAAGEAGGDARRPPPSRATSKPSLFARLRKRA